MPPSAGAGAARRGGPGVILDVQGLAKRYGEVAVFRDVFADGWTPASSWR
jgi:hypothetical protein